MKEERSEAWAKSKSWLAAIYFSLDISYPSRWLYLVLGFQIVLLEPSAVRDNAVFSCV